MAALSDGQVLAIIVVNTLSSLLSLFGSCTIIHLLYRSKKPSVYNRLMLGLSSFDSILALTLLLTPFLIPEAGGRKWAHGNDQTCLILGFFIQIGCTVPFYNMSLNVFFLLTVVYSMSEARITRWIEPTLHCISILYPLITASVGIGVNLFSELELGLFCWIGDYPRGCDIDPTLECTSTFIGWFYSGVPLLGSFIFLLLTNLFIFIKVQKILKQSSRFSIDSVIARSSVIDSRNSSTTNTIERLPIRSTTTGNIIVSGVDVEDSHTASVSAGSIGLRQNRRQTNENSRIRAVLIQATLYVSACLTTIFWMMMLRIFESQGVIRSDESKLFWLTLLAHITFPLQGFWNLLIFLRPKYLRWRRQAPTKSRYWAFQQCLANRNPLASAPPEVPPLSRYVIPLQAPATSISSSELRGISRKRDESESKKVNGVPLEKENSHEEEKHQITDEME
jgi:hypothetical protein